MTAQTPHGGAISAFADVTDVNNSTKRYPISAMRILYGINRIPQATITIPFGINAASWWGGNSLALPDVKYPHRIQIAWKRAGDSTDILFDGFISAISHSRAQSGSSVGVSSIIQAQGWLGFLSTQFTSVMRGTSPEIWLGNPWFTNATGMYLGNLVEGIADRSWTLSAAVISSLRAVCSAQDKYDIGFESGVSGASLAYQSLGKSIYTSDPASLVHSSYDSSTRYDIAYAALKSFTHPGGVVDYEDDSGSIIGGNLWTALLSFCEKFGFAVIPMIHRFALVPFSRPGRTAVGRASHPILDFGDISSYSMPMSGLKATPLRGVVMVDEESGGYWGLIDEPEIIGSYDISSMYSETNASLGRVIRVPSPGWFSNYDSGLVVADRLCKQIALDEAFGNHSLVLQLPYITGIAPGTLVELHGTDSFPTLGGRTILGLVEGIEYTVSADPVKVVTDVRLSYVMDRDLYEATSVSVHPVTSGYFLYAEMSGSVGY